jgi:hypothetical protein
MEAGQLLTTRALALATSHLSSRSSAAIAWRNVLRSQSRHIRTTPPDDSFRAARSSQTGMKGRCQCAKVQFITPLTAPLKMYICHCTECRHQSSSAFGITAVFPYFDIPDPLSLVSVYTRYTLQHRYMECLFCKNCGSRLLHRFRDQIPPARDSIAASSPPPRTRTVSVRAGCLDGLNKHLLDHAIHIWCQEAVVAIPDGVEQWQGRPDGGVKVK